MKLQKELRQHCFIFFSKRFHLELIQDPEGPDIQRGTGRKTFAAAFSPVIHTDMDLSFICGAAYLSEHMAQVLSAANLAENSNTIGVIRAEELTQSVKICTEHYTEQILDHCRVWGILFVCRQIFHLMVPEKLFGSKEFPSKTIFSKPLLPEANETFNPL